MASSEWINKNRFDPTYFPTMKGTLFFEGDTKIRSTTNYVVLLSLATVIATYGVITGSTASVIGAMIIAPQMTPIMATILAIALGAVFCDKLCKIPENIRFLRTGRMLYDSPAFQFARLDHWTP